MHLFGQKKIPDQKISEFLQKNFTKNAKNQ